MPFAGVNGQKLYYEVGGSGDTAVLLHGSFADADIMEAPATGLASGFRAIRIDRRGWGRSSPVDGPVSMAAEADDLAALLDWFGVTETHLLTHDDGAEVALEFCLRHPGRAKNVGLLAPIVEGCSKFPEAVAARADLLAAVRTDPRKGIDEKFIATPIFDVVREREGMVDRVGALFRKGAGTAYKYDRPPTSPTLFERLPQVEATVAVLVGDRDELDRLHCAETIADAIPGAELITFPGLSRFLHIEESRMVMRRLTDFYIPELEIER